MIDNPTYCFIKFYPLKVGRSSNFDCKISIAPATRQTPKI